jgi:hypothetical protein
MRTLVVLSVIAALIGFMQPIIFPGTIWRPDEWVVFSAAGAWVLLQITALVVHGKRGLWLLISSPLALYWPAGLTTLYLVCWSGIDCT